MKTENNTGVTIGTHEPYTPPDRASWAGKKYNGRATPRRWGDLARKAAGIENELTSYAGAFFMLFLAVVFVAWAFAVVGKWGH
jgi:hypothetical protein